MKTSDALKLALQGVKKYVDNSINTNFQSRGNYLWQNWLYRCRNYGTFCKIWFS